MGEITLEDLIREKTDELARRHPKPEGRNVASAEDFRRAEALRGSYLNQMFTGALEGAGNTIGMPVDFANYALMRMPARLADRTLGTDLESGVSDRPIGGSRWLNENFTYGGPGAAPPPDTTGKKLAHNFGRYGMENALMASLLAGRGEGLYASGQFAGGGPFDEAARAIAMNPGRTFASETAATTLGTLGEPVGEWVDKAMGGSGKIGAAAGEVMGEFLGAMLVPAAPRPRRGLGTGQLREQARAGYEAVENSGVALPPQGADMLADYVTQVARRRGMIGPDGMARSPALQSVLNELRSYSTHGANLDFRDYKHITSDLLDDAIGAAVTANRGKEAAVLREIKDEMVTVGQRLWDRPGIEGRLRDADVMWGRAARHNELVDQPVELGTERGIRNYTQANAAHGIQLEYGKLNRQAIQGNMPYLSPEERQLIDQLGTGNFPGYGAARAVGRYAPRGPVSGAANVLMGGGVGSALTPGAPWLGGAVGTTAMAGATSTAQRIARALQDRKVAELSNLIRTGQYLREPLLTPDKRALLAALLAGQVPETGATAP